MVPMRTRKMNRLYISGILYFSSSFASNSIHTISNYKNQKYTYFQHPINWIYKYEVKNWKNQIITGA